MRDAPILIEDRRPCPICCHNCGKEADTFSEFDARKSGWNGFSQGIDVKQKDGTTRRERIGECPDCCA